MPARIAIITTKFLEDYIGKILADLPQAGEYEVYRYSDFSRLAAIYESLPKSIKGIVTSGSFPARVLSLTFPNSPRLIRPFDNDNAGIFRLFLELLNDNRGLSLDRVYADVFDVAGLRPESYLLGASETDIADLIQKSVGRLSFEELAGAEERYARRHLELWQSGRIDVSITRFSSLMEKLGGAGLNVRFARPDMSYIRNILISALREVTIKDLTENLTCSILVAPKPGQGFAPKPGSRSQRILGRCLDSFAGQMNLNYHIQRRLDGFEIFTNKETARRLTEDFTTCGLRGFLAGRVDFELCIGYGIGFTLYQARINAVDAGREAANLPFGASGLIDENDRLIIPLDPQKNLVVPRGPSELVKDLAAASGLSCLTIQKIMSALNTLAADLITSEELSYKLSITKRSANRLLNALKKSGLAAVAERKQSTSRGRPEYVYKINIAQNEGQVE